MKDLLLKWLREDVEAFENSVFLSDREQVLYEEDKFLLSRFADFDNYSIDVQLSIFDFQEVLTQ